MIEIATISMFIWTKSLIQREKSKRYIYPALCLTFIGIIATGIDLGYLTT